MDDTASATSGAPAGAGHELRGQKIQALLTQLTSLQQEIYERSRHQHQIMGFQVTSVAAIVGVVATKQVSPLFLTVLVFTSSAFNLFWLDHHKQISRLGVHLGVYVERRVNALVGADLLGWLSDDFPKYRGPQFVRFAFKAAVAIMFLFPPAAALVVVATAFDLFSQAWWMVSLWCLGVIAFSYVTAVTYFMLWRYRSELQDVSADMSARP